MQSVQQTIDTAYDTARLRAVLREALAQSSDKEHAARAATVYEVDREELIGSGSMGQVYKGTWRARTVAIKVLDAAMPQRVYGLFESLFHVWKDLEQPNVVDIYGASTDEPRFFLCPYAPHRGLNTFLAGLAIESDLPRFMHEIALGMEYLHAEGVLHGELKARILLPGLTSKVLVDEKINCLISDFGQEEIRSEVLRLSGTSTPRARWHAPEPTRGPRVLTAEMDVYSYAICCVEILSMGGLPWPDLSDGDVRGLVLAGRRPDVPSTRFDTPALRELLRICWHQHPSVRPPFSKIVQETSILSEAFSSAVHKRPLITALGIQFPAPKTQASHIPWHPI
ncbi:kinase-like domain-containing protein [Mycena rebaudengoi]|nr:kinase-like domain-containing protein [Mycena rebaudengoi]